MGIAQVHPAVNKYALCREQYAELLALNIQKNQVKTPRTKRFGGFSLFASWSFLCLENSHFQVFL